MPVRAVIFDLFDTVVDLSMGDLPKFRIGERTLRGTHPKLHVAVARHADVDLGALVRGLAAVDAQHRVPRYDEGREYPTLERFRRLAERLGVEDPALPEELTRIHMAGIRAQARFLPHHVELFEQLHERVRIGICSNFSHTPTGYRILEDAGLLPHVDAVVISEEIGFRKPRPEIFEATLERLGAIAEETLHVGDQLTADVGGAVRAGITPVWVTRRVADPERELERHEGPPPEHVISDLAELRGIVGNARA